MPDLADADPVAVAHDWLKGHPQITDLLGGPEHVSGIPEGPWPHASIADGPSGDLRGMVWSAEFEIELEVVGHPTGSPGQAELRKQTLRLAKALCDMPDERPTTATDAVVSNVRPSGTLAWAPFASGQPRWIIGLLLTIRPPLTDPSL